MEGGSGAALVTGGATRLGKAMALALAGRGLNVAVHYRESRAEAEQTVTELEALNVKACALQADFRDEEAVVGLVTDAGQRLECGLNVLVNSAALFERDTFQSSTRNDWDRHMETNLRAPFLLMQEFSAKAPPPLMDSNGEATSLACVVNLLDHRVLRPTSEFISYTLSKMAFWSLTQIAAVALAPVVRVNAIGPGPTLPASRQSQEHFARQRQMAPLKRGAGPREIVSAMNFFLDNPSVSGQLICIEGGQNLSWKAPESMRKD